MAIPLVHKTPELWLEEFKSKDMGRIMTATWEVIKSRDAKLLSYLADRTNEIAEETGDVALGGAIRLNSDTVKFALRKLEFYSSRAGCLCELYPENYSYNPEDEASVSNVRIVQKTDIPYASEYLAECCTCAKRYNVKEGEYHFIIWAWKPA